MVDTEKGDSSDRWDDILSAIKREDVRMFVTLYDPRYITNRDPSSGPLLLDVLVEANARDMLNIVLGHDIDDEFLIKTRLYERSPELFLAHYHLYRAIRTRDQRLWAKWSSVELVNGMCSLTKESFLEISAKYGGVMFTRAALEMTLEINDSWSLAKDIATEQEEDDIRILIEKREKFLNSRMKTHWNRLHIAVYDNRPDVLGYILSQKLIDPSSTDSNLNTPLNLSIILGHEDCSKILLKCDHDPKWQNKFGQTVLHLAIEGSMEETANDILGGAVDLDVKDVLKQSPLMSALISGNKGIFENIISKLKNKKKMSEILRFDKCSLVTMDKLRADRTLPVTDRETYFTLCLKMNGELYDSLTSRLDESAVNFSDGNCNTLLHMAVEMLILNLVHAILTVPRQRIVNQKNKEGNSALHLLMKRCTRTDLSIDKEEVEQLIAMFLDKGADRSSFNGAGETLIQACLGLNDERIFQGMFFDSVRTNLSHNDLLAILERKWFSTLDIALFNADISVLLSFLKKASLVEIFTNCAEKILAVIVSSSPSQLLEAVWEELLLVVALRDLRGTFDLLCRLNIRLFKKMDGGETILTSLLKAKQYEYCRSLLGSLDDSLTPCVKEKLLDQKNDLGQTALHVVADFQDIELLEHLLLEGVNWDYEDNEGHTVLAILLGNVGQISNVNMIREVEKIVKIMIRGGQDVGRVGRDGRPLVDKCGNLDMRARLQRFQKMVRTSQRDYNAGKSENDKNICQICLDQAVNSVLQCGHPFCQDCLAKLLLCPSCREPIERRQSLYL